MEKGAVPTDVKYNGKTCKECSICGYIATSTVVEKHFTACDSKQVEREYFHYCSKCSCAFVFEGEFKKHCKKTLHARMKKLCLCVDPVSAPSVQKRCLWVIIKTRVVFQNMQRTTQ